MKKEKMNDKGFSLVELIIVIAIMAVLVVVLAPQYLKYVERSRNSTDMQNVTTLVTACQVYAADPDVASTAAFKTGKFFITVLPNGASVEEGDNKAAVDAALAAAAIKPADVKCKSKSTWASYKIVGDVQDGGNIVFSYESYTDDKATTGKNTKLSDKMAGTIAEE